MKGNCEICGDEIELQMCCDGDMCGCKGLPIELPLCSEKCGNEYDSRRKTSREWNFEYEKKYNVTILDPDGWDRKNFKWSWFDERITYEEFEKRAMKSTQIPLSEIKTK